MGIRMTGIDHEKAGVDVRALFSFTKKDAAQTMQSIRALPGVRGCILLSTCNRTELWLSADGEEDLSPTALVCQYRGRAPEEYGRYFTEREGDDAVKHLFYLTSGLRSMILAEDQIVTQVGEALAAARACFATDNMLEVLFRRAITAGKRVRTEVVFSHADRTAMDGAISMLCAQGFNLAGAVCLVIGNGEMGKLAAQALQEAGADVTVTVRQYRSGVVVIPPGCKRINYGERGAYIPRCRLVVSATASPNYTITEELFRSMEAAGWKNPDGLILIDLAVPRDIEPSLGDREGVALYTIDDFRMDALTPENRAALKKADAILGEEMREYEKWRCGQDLLPRILRVEEAAGRDLELRFGHALGRMHLPKEEEEMIRRMAGESARKVIGKLIFGVRDQVGAKELSDCLEGMEKTYE